jgi:hypothetical protein
MFSTRTPWVSTPPPPPRLRRCHRHALCAPACTPRRRCPAARWWSSQVRCWGMSFRAGGMSCRAGACLSAPGHVFQPGEPCFQKFREPSCRGLACDIRGPAVTFEPGGVWGPRGGCLWAPAAAAQGVSRALARFPGPHTRSVQRPGDPSALRASLLACTPNFWGPRAAQKPTPGLLRLMQPEAELPAALVHK